LRRGITPGDGYAAIGTAIQKTADSYSEESTTPPSPVRFRSCNAPRIPIAADIPVAASTNETPSRTGGPPSWPMILIGPLCAYMSGS
jgi:hypothetical protein